MYKPRPARTDHVNKDKDLPNVAEHLSKSSEAFLRRSYNRTALELSKALDAEELDDTAKPGPSYAESIADPESHVRSDVYRRLHILVMTFAATWIANQKTLSAERSDYSVVNSIESLGAAPWPDAPTTHAQLRHLATASDFPRALWSFLVEHTVPASASSLQESRDSFALAPGIDPSLIAAYAYSCMRAGFTDVAAHVVDVWFRNPHPGIESVLYDALDDPKTLSPRAQACVAHWYKLYDAYGTQILPKLDNFDAALDFTQSHSVESGGVVPIDHVDRNVATIVGLKQARDRDIEHQAALRREEAENAKQKKSQRLAEAYSRKQQSDGKQHTDGKQTDGKQTDGKQQVDATSDAVHNAPSKSGFANMRSALSDYMAEGHAKNSDKDKSVAPTPVGIPAYMQFVWTVIKNQPGRLVGVLVFFYAALSWLRRPSAPAPGSSRLLESGSPSGTSLWSRAWASLLETVKMGAGPQGL